MQRLNVPHTMVTLVAVVSQLSSLSLDYTSMLPTLEVIWITWFT